ncbi:MAG: efflux RND transporter periplasmic adaptor subunit [Candidatus Margulisiibacteriota bacterium]
MFKSKIFWIVLIIIIAVVAAFVFLRMMGSAVEIKAARVERGNILSTISASGLVRAKSVKLGSARMAGRVEWVGVNEGDRVVKGQTLVKLDGFEQAEKEYKRLQALHAKGFVSDLELERTKTALDNAQIVSPISGLVAEKSVIAGESISPGVPVMTVVDIDHPWAEIQIDEVDIAQAKMDQRVRFTTDAFPDEEFFGKIIWINKKAELKKVGGRVRMDEEDLVFRGKVEFEDGRDILKPGMSVYAEIITGEKQGVVVAPREAITLREGKRIAFLVRGDQVRQQEVELGIKDAEKVEILKGLAKGQMVAVSNLDNLKDKVKISIIKNDK